MKFVIRSLLAAFLVVVLGSHAVMAESTTTYEANLVDEYKDQFDRGEASCDVAMNRQIRALDALSAEESYSVLSTEVREGICYGQIQVTISTAE